MVENVEKLDSELGVQAFFELPVFEQREIPVSKAGVAENVAAHRSEAPVGRRSQNRGPLHVAAKIGQRRHGELSVGLRGTHAGGRNNRIAAKSGPETRNWGRTRGEIRGLAREIPSCLRAVVNCVGSREV